jgi:hypothetical protein
MLNTIPRAVTRTLAGAALVMSAAACSDKFLDVTNPNVIDASTVDPASGATSLAASAQQNYVTMFGALAMYSGWFAGEANVSDTFPTRNEFGFRNISDLNSSLQTEVWQPLSLAAASAKIVLDLALPTPTTNINLARAATFRGFSLLAMAGDFCTGTLSSGPELTTSQMLDTAIFWFSKAVDVGNANGSTDGKNLANASLVGRARAKLQKGDKAGAATDAAAVPAGFNYNMTYQDDAANRARLSNLLWRFTFDRGSIDVAAAYQVSDPRVPWKSPAQHNLQPQDVVPGGFFIQQKYPAYNSPIRLASKIEADYIVAEAGDGNAQLALIAARRAANAQPAYSGATDAASVLAELFVQRGREFYLEGKRLADWRRNPSAAAYGIAPSGSVYIKPGYPNIGTQTCYPIPRAERDNNPNMK